MTPMKLQRIDDSRWRIPREGKMRVEGIVYASDALMATDNEGGWTFPDGDVNILLADGNVRTLSYMQMEELYQLGPFNKDNPVLTHGPESPIPECKKLAN